MNAVQYTCVEEDVARKLLEAYDLLCECARSSHAVVRKSARKARVALGPVILALDLRRETASDDGEFQGLFMDG
jgi:hypothetical protein